MLCFFLAVSDDFVFLGPRAADFGVRLASIGCFYGPAAFYRPGNCGARFVPRFTQNQHMSALLAERLHPPCLSRVRSTLQIAAHDGSPASWSSPWREHGHSDQPSMETQFLLRLGGCAKIDRTTRVRPPYSLLRRLRQVFWAESKTHKTRPIFRALRASPPESPRAYAWHGWEP